MIQFWQKKDISTYLVENGCLLAEDLDCNSTAFAAQNGHLDCLKYAHVNGCGMCGRACAYAAYYGHLKCLRYAHVNGCEWDGCTGCSKATLKGHVAS